MKPRHLWTLAEKALGRPLDAPVIVPPRRASRVGPSGVIPVGDEQPDDGSRFS